MKSQEFLKYFNAVAKFAAKTDERPVLCGVHTKVYPNLNTTMIESADGYHLAHCMLPETLDLMGGKSYLIQPNRRTSKGHLVQTRPNKKDNSDVIFAAESGVIDTCVCGAEKFTCEQINYYPDTSILIPGKKVVKITLSLLELDEIVQSGRNSVEIDKDGTCYPAAVLDFPGIRMGYNPIMLEKGIAFIKLFESMYVDLYLQPTSSCAIIPAGGEIMRYDTPTYIFMPMGLD